MNENFINVIHSFIHNVTLRQNHPGFGRGSPDPFQTAQC